MKLADFDFRVWNRKINSYVSVTYQLEKIRDFVFEVVGNIHENADLLNNHSKEQK